MYHLFDGIHYSVKNAAEKNAYREKLAEARAAAAEQEDALKQAARLDKAEAFFAQKLSIGSFISHKSFGNGIITAIPDEHTVEATFSTRESPVRLGWRACITSDIISFKTDENAAEYDEMASLIYTNKALRIRANVVAAEKKLNKYSEYLQA